ncbi:MAG: alpha-2-macroglobulin family protein, partial [Bacteroidia bacterium]
YFDEWITLKNNQQKVEIPVKEEHIGGLFVTVTAIAENRFYHKTEKIDVPWPKRDLEIITSTWRDKTKPGAQEKWIFTVKGPNAEKAAAEMLAGMYDASLDAFLPHNWMFDINPEIYAMQYTNALGFGGLSQGVGHQLGWNGFSHPEHRGYDEFINGYMYGYYGMRRKDIKYLAKRNVETEVNVAGGVVRGDQDMKFAPPAVEEQSAQQKPPTQVRKNKNETAFFYPQLRTNEKGEISFEFTMPDALTRWKFMAFAHTQDLKYGSYQNTIITQKELMIQPNLPRFLRAGDEIEFSANLTNLSGEAVKSEVRIKLFDAYTMKYLGDEIMENKASATQNISLQNGETKNIRWKIKTPQKTDGILYQLIATGGKFSDGEEGLIPVLPNRMMVTETLPMYVRGNSTKNYTFDALNKGSKTADPYKLTLEITSNPSWFAVQALPYLMESQYENAEQVFNLFYANAISQHILKSNPQIKQVFESWKTGTALQSNLEKNQELKNLLLQETPWLAEGRNETERKQRIALLFDENNMAASMESTISKLEQMQRPDGGWPWFEGMPTDRFITQYIITGLGRMEKMNIQTVHLERLRSMMIKAIIYMDEQMLAEHENIKKHHAKTLDANHLSTSIVQYFYARSYFKYLPMQKPYQFAYVYWQQQITKYWTSVGLQQKAMLAIAMRQIDNDKLAHKIMHSVDEYALHSDEMGMYWKEAQTRGYFWYQQPTETQSLLIEAYDLVEHNAGAVEEMKLWLLKQKQTQNWGSSKATADAVYALIMTGKNQLASQKQVKVFLGGTLYDPSKADIKPEQGTGYYKNSWSRTEIKPEQGTIKLQKEDEGAAWGAAYYQYYEDINAIKGNSGSLSISKSLFVKENTAKGPQLKPITENPPLKTGDLVTVKVRIKTDRNMEYVHVKDMRAAALEPTETISGYQWKGGLGYYQAIKDASMNFFISYLPKGEYTFEYTLRVSQSGTFSNGISQIQCFYAPEFSGQTGSVKLNITK